MKKIKYLFLILILFLVGCTNASDDSKFTIVSTSFPGYDFARAIVGDDASVSMLVKPGTEVHSYDPSIKDIINIQNSDIFIYVGGESESWVDDILSSLDTSKMKIIRLMDYVDLTHESDDEHEEEYDEHIWTSPKNAIKLVNAIYNVIYDTYGDKYLDNKNAYVKSLELLDKEIVDIVANSNRNIMIFGDRFPFKYFVLEYDLEYYSAFPGCSSETEPSAKTISDLIDKVNNEKIPVIFYLEMSDMRVANIIAEDTGVKTLMFHSIHNLTKDEFDKGLTYVDVMRMNISNLREALE